MLYGPATWAALRGFLVTNEPQHALGSRPDFDDTGARSCLLSERGCCQQTTHFSDSCGQSNALVMPDPARSIRQACETDQIIPAATKKGRERVDSRLTAQCRTSNHTQPVWSVFKLDRASGRRKPGLGSFPRLHTSKFSMYYLLAKYRRRRILFRGTAAEDAEGCSRRLTRRRARRASQRRYHACL